MAKSKRKSTQNNYSFKISNQKEDCVDIRIEGEIGYQSYWWEDDEDDNRILTSKELRAELDRITKIQASRIRVYINSLGGLVDHALNMYDALVSHPASVTTIIEGGFSASAATIIFMAGVERKISENALFLVHKSMISPWAWTFNENELEDLLEGVRATDGRIKAIYEKNGVSVTDIEPLMNANNGSGKWISPGDVEDYGFATEVLEAKDLLTASAMQGIRLNKQRLPLVPKELMNKVNNLSKKSKGKNMSNTSWFEKMFGSKSESEVKNDLGEIKANLDKLKAQKTALETANADLVAQVEGLTSEKKDLDSQIGALKIEKTSLEATNAVNIKAKEEEIAAVKLERDSIQAKFDKTQGIKSEVEGKDDPELLPENLTSNQKAYQNNEGWFAKK